LIADPKSSFERTGNTAQTSISAHINTRPCRIAAMHSLVFWGFCASGLVMIPAIALQLFLGLGRAWAQPEKDFNNPPGVAIWCGKAYKEGVCYF
jgi:hypothetical protein